MLAKMPTCAVENNLSLSELKSDVKSDQVSKETCCRLQRFETCLRNKLNKLPQCEKDLDTLLKSEASNQSCEYSVWCLDWTEWPLILYIILIAVAILLVLAILVFFIFRKCRSNH